MSVNESIDWSKGEINISPENIQVTTTRDTGQKTQMCWTSLCTTTYTRCFIRLDVYFSILALICTRGCKVAHATLNIGIQRHKNDKIEYLDVAEAESLVG